MIRDAEATRQRLLDAARAEFAAYGIAGARVDRIAEAAGSNKAQIYHYYGSKDQLFDAVFEGIVASTVSDIPIDVHNLPEYAAQLADGYAHYPDIMRLATWQRLERAGDAPLPLAVESIRHKIDAIAQAQQQGIVPDHFPADVLLTLILHLAATWAELNPELATALDSRKKSERRHYIVNAVGRLLME